MRALKLSNMLSQRFSKNGRKSAIFIPMVIRGERKGGNQTGVMLMDVVSVFSVRRGLAGGNTVSAVVGLSG